MQQRLNELLDLNQQASKTHGNLLTALPAPSVGAAALAVPITQSVTPAAPPSSGASGYPGPIIISSKSPGQP